MASISLQPLVGTVVTVKAPWGCHVDSTFEVKDGDIIFKNKKIHVEEGCICPRSPNLASERIEEEVISAHVHNLLESGKIGLTEMSYLLGCIKLGLPVEEKYELPWNEVAECFKTLTYVEDVTDDVVDERPGQ
ncbi:hypothetical protein GGS21DRAFT_488837 [Xylaria nigripes]|nr:hypothetical protein GGS21DRAFT_488837 [Xylaria nigripes]